MTEKLALIDYGAGNLHSVESALVAAGALDISVTSDPDVVRQADRIVLPGVGAFGACITALKNVDGMIEAMTEKVLQQGTPFLGICVGMQLLASRGEEFGGAEGLGWIPGIVRSLEVRDPACKIPHMGWNDVTPVGKPGIINDGEAYFLHSFAFHPDDQAHLLALTNHDGPVTAAVGRDTIIGVQFHPEKSQKYGLSFLSQFLEWRP